MQPADSANLSTLDSPVRNRQLFLLRHAKSSWGEPSLADFDRPLNARGRHAAPLIGDKLHQQHVHVDIILASTAVRVRETLDLLLPAWQTSAELVWDKHLYLANPETIEELLGSLDTNWSSVMVVGHNPGLSQLASWLLEVDIELPTAAVISLLGRGASWTSALRHRPWEQQFFWKPKEL